MWRRIDETELITEVNLKFYIIPLKEPQDNILS